MNQSTLCVPKARELPEGFVYIDELIEDSIIDAKYFGTDNFMGRPANGYEQNLVVMSKEAAEEYGLGYNLVAGANIAGFKKVATAMMEQGIF